LHTLAGVVGDGSTAGRELGNLRRGRDVGEEDTLGEVIANLELRHVCCGCRCYWWLIEEKDVRIGEVIVMRRRGMEFNSV
jgi:hypothetical protein